MIRGLLILGAALLASPVAGDWLVLRDGTRLETEGPWEVKGRQVVFTRPGGGLAALRLADVDLESSAEATDVSQAEPAVADPATAEPPPPGKVRRRPSVLTLTDDDLRSGRGPDAEDPSEPVAGEEDAPEGGDDGEADSEIELGDGGADQEPATPAGATSSDAAPQPVVVVSWREQESASVDGLEIVGSVRNQGSDVAADIQVQVKVSDEDGAEIVDTRAFLERSSLAPGRGTNFRALLPGVYSLLEDPTFEVTSEGFTLGLVKDTEDGSGDEVAGEDDEFAEPEGDLDDYAEPGDDFDDLEPEDDLDDPEPPPSP